MRILEIKVEKSIIYNPLLGRYRYAFDWQGTKVEIEGRVGAIVGYPALNASSIRFDGESRTESIGLGVDDLKRIFQEQGGELEPPALVFPPYIPARRRLRKKPYYEVRLIGGARGLINGVEIGVLRHGSFIRGIDETTLPIFKDLLRPLTNLHVRRKYKLLPSFSSEGGFHGKEFQEFEVRNAFNYPGVFVNSRDSERIRRLIEMGREPQFADHVAMLKKKRAKALRKERLLKYALEEWGFFMSELLRYPWWRLSYDSLTDKWEAYCRLQDVLLKLMSAEDAKALLAFAQKEAPWGSV